jgi:secernin
MGKDKDSEPGSCDTMVALGSVTNNQQTIFAKNSDRPADECQPLLLKDRVDHPKGIEARCQFVSFPEVETTFRHVGSQPYWCWGYEHGFNEHQVVIGNEALGSKLDPATEGKLIGMEILRLGLERGRTASEATTVMTDLISRYGQGKFENDANVRTYDNGFIVADPREAFVIETAGHEWAVKQVEGALGISNVYSVEADATRLSTGAESFARQQGWVKSHDFNFADAYSKSERVVGSGAMRRGRSCALLSQRKGEIDAKTMIAILSDHSNGENPREEFQASIGSPPSICVHSNEDGSGNTAASLVADLCDDGSRLPVYWCSMYSPCLGIFLPMFIEGRIPAALSMGGGEPGDESPWWLFHKLSRLAREMPEDRIPIVRDQWRGLQSSLFECAYDVARECKALIDDGFDERAGTRLTAYMEDNVTLMLDRLRGMLADFEKEQKKVSLAV